MMRRRRREELSKSPEFIITRLSSMSTTTTATTTTTTRRTSREMSHLLAHTTYSASDKQLVPNTKSQQAQVNEKKKKTKKRKKSQHKKAIRWFRRPAAPLAISLVGLIGGVICFAALTCAAQDAGATASKSALRFDAGTNAYTGLTFSFDPRLDRRVEQLHFEHWLSVMQHTSSLLHESLNGRAHLSEVRVLIPYKWRHKEWPVLHKPGVPIIMNRRLRYTDSDVIVGFEDPIYKETPFAVQHDECAKQGLHIQMPISFLEQSPSSSLGAESASGEQSSKLKARLLLREFAAHRYGIFKETGYRNDPMYPPVAALAGCTAASECVRNVANNRTAATRTMLEEMVTGRQVADEGSATTTIRGFDENWQECQFAHANGSTNLRCVPYLARVAAPHDQPLQSPPLSSFNLMGADPFSYSSYGSSNSAQQQQRYQPVEWRQVADAAKWHFCGENFVPQAAGRLFLGELQQSSTSMQHQQQQQQQDSHFQHNQLAANKQNIMCNERSALSVIKSSDDFRAVPFRPSTFNRLPATIFKYLQEMPPRLVLCVEYGAHLYQSRRRENGILESAIGKYLAYDLIADTELSLILFGQNQSTRSPFKRLDSSVDSRLTLYSPTIDPYDEPPVMYSQEELNRLGLGLGALNQQWTSGLVKGTCSFTKLIAEISAALQLRPELVLQQYNDVGADVVVITTGLFIEEVDKIDELLRSAISAGLLRADNVRLNLIIYPAAMLFDTKPAANAKESELIVSNRLAKLQVIERLTGARLHFVREQQDSEGNVKMTTLVQFYKIFEHLSRGNSWDQTHSWSLVQEKQVEVHPQQQQQSHVANGSQLKFEFELDASGHNELIVGFIDPKQHRQSRSGKRFVIKNLELRSPGGHLVMADSAPWSMQVQPGALLLDHQASGNQVQHSHGHAPDDSDSYLASLSSNNVADHSAHLGAESALFPYRTQLSLAGFHLRAAHLAPLNSSARLSGTWTLTGTSDEPSLQTSAVAMLRANPLTGDTITARCWVQTYHAPTTASNGDLSATAEQQPEQGLRQVKVFVQTLGAAGAGPVQELDARMEVQDELGNIVQNVNMLDDGLGAPDMTRGDGIHSAQVQRAERPGYYRVSVELASGGGAAAFSKRRFARQTQTAAPASGQDAPCCGSFVPQPAADNGLQVQDTRHLSRQLYCGTFYVDKENKLAQRRLPRINNISVVSVDQDARRVTLRWHEPSLDIAAATSSSSASPAAADQSLDAAGEALALKSAANRSLAPRRELDDSTLQQQQQQQLEDQIEGFEARARLAAGGLLVASGSGRASSAEQPLSSRYEIKLFEDRQALMRAFDSKQVGRRFHEWDVEGSTSNLSSFGGLKELTLRIPYKQDEGVYYIAMKVYNNLGTASPLSHIVEFWLSNNLTLDEAEARYGPLDLTRNSMTSAGGDSSGSGARGAGGGSGNQLNYLLARGTLSMDGLSLLVFFGVAAFVISVVCISLLACLFSSFGRRQKQLGGDDDDEKAVACGGSMGTNGAGSGSSVVSGSCSATSSGRESEVASSAGGSQCGARDVELGGGAKLQGLSAVDQELHYNTIQQQQALQQHQAQLIQSQLMASHLQQQEMQGYHNQYSSQVHDIYQQHYDLNDQQQQQQQDQQQQQQQQQQNWLQHTMVNGYAYATVQQQQQQQQPMGLDSPGVAGDLAQNGLAPISPVQSWPADILLSHYDKVKQARERNEAPPVMRIETIENQSNHQLFNHHMDGLPAADDSSNEQLHARDSEQQLGGKNSYLVRQQRNQMPSYFNLQLQQQLSSVLKSKQRNSISGDNLRSSPALEGVRELDAPAGFGGQLANPPTQYVYCTALDAANNNGLQSAADPSIYSQATNLQQVTSPVPHSSAAQVIDSSYYANHQWAPQSIYSQQSDNQSQHQHQQQTRLKLGGNQDEEYANAHQSNSAISEV